MNSTNGWALKRVIFAFSQIPIFTKTNCIFGYEVFYMLISDVGFRPVGTFKVINFNGKNTVKFKRRKILESRKRKEIIKTKLKN